MKKLRDWKLGVRLGLGFGAMVIISASLGVSGWLGLEAVTNNGFLASRASECRQVFGDCRREEKNFRVQGVSNSGENQHAEAMGELNASLDQLAGKGLKKQDLEKLQDIRKALKVYESLFGREVDALSQKEAAFKEWKKLGGNLTATLDNFTQKVIAPALKTSSGDDLKYWTNEDRLWSENIVEPFLLMRLSAVYLIATNKEQQWVEFQKQLLKVKPALERFEKEGGGNKEPEALAPKLKGDLAEYEKAAGRYHSAIVGERKAGENMSAAGNKASRIISALEKDLVERQKDAGASAIRLLGILSLTGVLVGVVLAFSITRGITRPVVEAVELCNRMSEGDLTANIQTDREDEVGQLLSALNHTGSNIRQMVTEINTGIETLASSSTDLSAISSRMADGVEALSGKAGMVSAAAEESSSNTSSVAANMGEMTSNLSSVAAATEQMSATIGEIASNAEKARAISVEATQEAESVSAIMKELGRAAQEIGNVTETITSISAQTNLLALNATIEAARAGAAGKGFAVVANEIKELAQQTSSATEDIKGRIASIQSSTSGAIGDIQKISEVIKQVGETVSNIAAAIEEQSVVTRDVASNIAQASSGVRDSNERVAQTATVSQSIAQDIAQMHSTLAELIGISEQTKASSSDLSGLSGLLKEMVVRFRV